MFVLRRFLEEQRTLFEPVEERKGDDAEGGAKVKKRRTTWGGV